MSLIDNANFTLALAFPPRKGLKGACTRIVDLQWAKPDPLFCPTKRSAVRLIVAAASACYERYGHGNKAAKRAAKALVHAEAECASLNRQIALKRKETVDAGLLEARQESRSVSHHYRVNSHD